MKTYVAFYKAKGDWKDSLIRFWTRSIYSHCELVIGDKWYSSSDRDGGVRVKTMREFNSNSWDFVEVDVDTEYVMSVFKEHKGKGYDWINILFCQWIPLGIHSKRRMICSEFIAECLNFDVPYMYSPENLKKALSDF